VKLLLGVAEYDACLRHGIDLLGRNIQVLTQSEYARLDLHHLLRRRQLVQARYGAHLLARDIAHIHAWPNLVRARIIALYHAITSTETAAERCPCDGQPHGLLQSRTKTGVRTSLSQQLTRRKWQALIRSAPQKLA
jgi:hypothetical protein